MPDKAALLCCLSLVPIQEMERKLPMLTSSPNTEGQGASIFFRRHHHQIDSLYTLSRVFREYRYRLLHYCMDRNEFLWADHRRPTFPEPFVTKPVVTQGTNRYQMKDMDIIFLWILRIRGRQFKKVFLLRTFFNRFWPKSNWSAKHFLFDLNLELHSGLKVRGSEINFSK